MGKQYSIKEVASLLGINANKIRFYEKKGLINPERGEENEYRYFSDEEVIKLHSILLYRALGLSVKDIEELLKNTTKENYLGNFYNQWKVVNDKIHELSQMRQALEHIMDEMYLMTDGQYTTEILKEIQHNVEKLTVKNNWKDKWAFDNWARSYDRDVKADKGTLKIYENYDEYYTNIRKLEQYVGNHARKINKIQIDKLCWIVTICR